MSVEDDQRAMREIMLKRANDIAVRDETDVVLCSLDRYVLAGFRGEQCKFLSERGPAFLRPDMYLPLGYMCSLVLH